MFRFLVPKRRHFFFTNYAKVGDFTTHLRFHAYISPNYVTRSFSSSDEAYKSDELKRKRAFTVSYLVNSCGLSMESAKSISKVVNFDSPDKPNTALEFFNKHGFTKPQITKVVRSFPHALVYDTESSLLPKLEFFSSMGCSMADIAMIVTYNPRILASSLNNQLVPCYNFLKTILPRDDMVVKALKRNSRVLLMDVHNNLAHKVSILREAGVPKDHITRLMRNSPGSLCLAAAKFEGSVKKAIELGFKPSSGNFIYAFRIISQLQQSTFDHKVEVFKRWGWSDDDVWSAFKKQPQCMSYSENKIMQAMDFYVNKVGLQSSAIAKNPGAIFFSLEKRIIPRCLVVALLLSKGLLFKEDVFYSTILGLSEEGFLTRFVMKYPDHSKELLDTFNKKVGLKDLGPGLQNVVP